MLTCVLPLRKGPLPARALTNEEVLVVLQDMPSGDPRPTLVYWSRGEWHSEGADYSGPLRAFFEPEDGGTPPTLIGWCWVTRRAPKQQSFTVAEGRLRR